MKKQFKVFVKKLLSLVLISFSAVTIADVKAGFEGKTAELSLIISNTDTSRRKGLMHQSVLGKNTGMLFVWPFSKKQCMWMKNTSLSLSVAYLSQDGKILESGGIHEPEFFKRFFASMNKSIFLDENLPPN